MIHHVVHSNRTQNPNKSNESKTEKKFKTQHVKRSQGDQQMSLELNAFSR